MIAYFFSALLAVVLVVTLILVIRALQVAAGNILRRHTSWPYDGPSRSPERCRACAGPKGWHDEGCSRLDRLHAGEVA